MAKKDESQLVVNPLLQMAPLASTEKWYKDFVDFSKKIMKVDLDYGIVPGTGSKPSLLKPGAEKLRFVYGLGTSEEMTDKVIDLDKGFISYSYKVSVKNKAGEILAECEGNCNSFETKFRYLWVQESALPAGIDKTKLTSRTSKITEFDFAISKAETTGQYGKPAEYWAKWKDAIQNGTAKMTTRETKNGRSTKSWEMGGTMYRVQNPDIMGMMNTIMKMAQKRAFVGAMLLATGASEFYTQDIEDMVTEVGIPDVAMEGQVMPTAPVAPAQTSSNVTEGEVVEPVSPQQVQPVQQVQQQVDEVHLKRLQWIKQLIDSGKITLDRDLSTLTPNQSLNIIEGYKKFLGK